MALIEIFIPHNPQNNVGIGINNRFILPAVGSSRTVHQYLRIHKNQWFTREQITRATDLSEKTVQAALSLVVLDLRVIERQREILPELGKKDEDVVPVRIREYAFVPLLAQWMASTKKKKGGT